MTGRWWRRGDRVAHFDLYTRGTLYALSSAVPLLALGMLLGEPGLPAVPIGVVLALIVLQTAACLTLVHRGIARFRDGTPWPRATVSLAAAATVVTAVVAVAVLPSPTGVDWAVAVFAVLGFLAALSVAVSLRVTIAIAAAALALPLLARLAPVDLPMSDEALAGWLVAMVAGTIGVLSGYRGSLWMLGIVWELDRARGVQAQLAVAEERLRFSRDLHDVVGRGLAVVALKSELAAQLAKRGRAEAADEMLEVRQVAHDLLTEVREVVRGYRMADLDAELAGARSVLASAGVEAQMLTDGGGLPVDAQSTLGWVVREGTTNVLRHSDARSCTVSLRREDGSVVLAMENDGVRDADASGPPRLGSGLIGLAERLASQGGAVVAEHRPSGRFRLTARLPVKELPMKELPVKELPVKELPAADR